MYCRKCGKQIADDKEYCEECSVTETQKNVEKTDINISSNTGGKKKCCPKCKSRNLQIVTNTEFHSETKGGGYSGSKGCCGYMTFGPLGLLCGACGSKSKTTITSSSTDVWVCRDCGNKFRDLADINADIAKREKSKATMPKTFYIIGIVFFVIMAIVSINSFSGIPFSMVLQYGLGSLFGIVFESLLFPAIMVVAGIVTDKQLGNQIECLKEEKNNIEQNGYIDE